MLPCLPVMRTSEGGGVRSILQWARQGSLSGLSGAQSGAAYIQSQVFHSVSLFLPGNAAYTNRINVFTERNFFLDKVSIGTRTPAISAELDVSSTTRGFLPPRVTTGQKNVIGSPVAGLLVYDTTLGKLSVFTGVYWETITSVPVIPVGVPGNPRWQHFSVIPGAARVFRFYTIAG